MSTYVDRIKAYHEGVVSAGIAQGYSAAVMRLSLTLEYQWRIYRTHIRLAERAWAEKRKDEARAQEAKRNLTFRTFINTARTAQDGRLALALLREREAGR